MLCNENAIVLDDISGTSRTRYLVADVDADYRTAARLARD